MSRDRLAIPPQVVTSTISCVQHYVSIPQFTQHGFFSEFGIGMDNDAFASAADIVTHASFNPWESVNFRSRLAIVADLKRHQTICLSDVKLQKYELASF